MSRLTPFCPAVRISICASQTPERAYAHWTIRQKDFLGQLISVMCESSEVGRLNSLGFVGFQKDVEAILSFKARNSDPLRFPNYYKVLYSWHISKGDYRSGQWPGLPSVITNERSWRDHVSSRSAICGSTQQQDPGF